MEGSLKLFVATMAIIASWPVGAEPKNSPSVVELSYNGQQTLDFYEGAGGQAAPLVVFIHGGGWKHGDKRGFRRAAGLFVDAGFAAASVNYGLVPASSVEEAAADVASAIMYLKANASRLGLDSDRISLVGHSAGAYYAALVSANEAYLPPKTIKAVALLDCRACDLEAEMQRRRAATLASVFGNSIVKWKTLSPITYLDAADPLFWLAFISSDVNSVSDARAFAERLNERGGYASIQGYWDVIHGDFVKRLGDAGFAPTQALLKFLIANG